MILPPIVAHRGASARAPENTPSAFRKAASLGASWIECDVRLTACATPLLLHDATVDRTTDGRGRLADLALADVRTLDAGAWFDEAFAGERLATLGETLELASQLGLGLNVEIKAESDVAARKTAAIVVPELVAWSGEVVVSSFVVAALEEARAQTSDLPLGLLVRRSIQARHVDLARSLACVSLHADRRAFDLAAVSKLGDAGLWPVAYTVNAADEARALWRAGVRTLISDRPDVLEQASANAPLRQS